MKSGLSHSSSDQLTQERWNTFSYVIQMANAGGEVERMIKRREQDDNENSNEHITGALELLELTGSDPKNIALVGELNRVIDSIRDA